MKSLSSYLNHVRKQKEEVKLIHAVIVSSLLTGLFAGVYLYLVRGMTPPTPEILKTEQVIYQSKS
jgi:hypothetical protein